MAVMKRLQRKHFIIVSISMFSWACLTGLLLMKEIGPPTAYFLLGSYKKDIDNHSYGSLEEQQRLQIKLPVDPFFVHRMDRSILPRENCTETRRPTYDQIIFRNTHWQVQKDQQNEIVVYSAYYDDRPDVGITPVIRILAVSSSHSKNLFCQLWYDDIPHPLISKVTVQSSGGSAKVHGMKFGQYLYTCALASSLPMPTHVSIVTKQCNRSNIFLPITILIRTLWQHEFGVCVAIAFGRISPDTFVEWIEYLRLFGVSEINVYNANITDSNSLAVFDFYQSAGVLRVYSMPPPLEYYDYKSVKRASPASLNDCMLRNMYRYRYIVTLDFDEIIVPRVADNYSDMLQYINRQKRLKAPAASYTFRNVYFFLNIETNPDQLLTMRHLTRANPNNFLFASKSMVDPRTCVSLFNHYCWIRFPRYKRKWTVDVDSKVAMSHHYRSCVRHSCSKFMVNLKQDTFLLKYRSLVHNRVNDVFRQIPSLYQFNLNHDGQL